eukprot:768158-Hanusia_phi.AAC.6
MARPLAFLQLAACHLLVFSLVSTENNKGEESRKETEWPIFHHIRLWEEKIAGMSCRVVLSVADEF